MFSLLINFFLLWEQAKQKALQRQKENLKRYNQYLHGYIEKKLDEVRDTDNPDPTLARKINASKVKIFLHKALLSFLKALLAFLMFFETLPIFFSILFFSIGLIVVAGIVVVVLIVTTSLQGLTSTALENFKAPSTIQTKTTTATLGNAQWTEQELAIRGIKLTEYEKNLYRLVMLAKNSIDGYGGSPLLPRYGTSRDLATMMVVGVSSTETGMQFYQNGKNYDILHVPSDIPPNSLGYGFLGMSTSKTLSSYYSSNVVDNIKAAYNPNPYPSYDAAFAPWGIAMSARHLYNDASNSSTISSPNTEDLMNKMMDSFGIVANRGAVKEYLAWFLAQAQYQGATVSEYPGYLAFWCALYAASSDKDSERSFSKWGIVADDYSESTMRSLVLGSTPYKSIGSYATPEGLPGAGVSAYLTLNGNRIDKPLWAYVYEKFGDKPEVKNAWSQALRFAGTGSGVADRILNYHYGFNSYLQGKKIIQDIAGKLVGGLYTQTPGVGQGVWNGKTIADYINSTGSNLKAKALSMQRYWGTAAYTEPQKILGADWKPDNKWGVPFYSQADLAETYAYVPWGDTNDTFVANGCMIYAFSYAASTLTGKLINPPEMASGMYVTNALVNAGVVTNSMPAVYKALGLNCEIASWGTGQGVHPTGATFDKVWTRVDQTLDNGGVVVVRGGYPWTSSVNHFFVITGKTVEGGNVMYSVYTSVSPMQTMTTWSKSAFEGTLQCEAYLITK